METDRIGDDGQQLQLTPLNSPLCDFPLNRNFSRGLAGWRICAHGDMGGRCMNAAETPARISGGSGRAAASGDQGGGEVTGAFPDNR